MYAFISQVNPQELSPGLSALYLHTILSKCDYLLSKLLAERRAGGAPGGNLLTITMTLKL